MKNTQFIVYRKKKQKMEIRRLEAAAGFDLDSPTEILKRNTSPPPKKKKKKKHT